jgi:hypothetical protein
VGLYHLVREEVRPSLKKNGTAICMRDAFHNLAEPMNRLINSNRTFADTFLTIGQLFVDINLLFLTYYL